MHAIVTLTVNGDRREVGVPTHYTLLEALRYGIGLTGSKQGCDKGDCGACTVLVDGQPTLSCITPVWEAEGKDVETVEGLAGPGGPHPLQAAFDACGAAQCGFCTPGILMSAWGLLRAGPVPSREEIREALSGNLCRCTGYTKIYEAVGYAAARLAPSEGQDTTEATKAATQAAQVEARDATQDTGSDDTRADAKDEATSSSSRGGTVPAGNGRSSR